ncbi:MAG: peroxide stress protein YaaA [Acidimicrobiaceae bacterium]|nr:peroxide stress protein YaaA [Acidimicrobiaceae bacterium]
MTQRIFLLVPPSEAKEHGGRRAARVGPFDVELDALRRRVVENLGQLLATGSLETVENLLGARSVLLERAVDSTRRLITGDSPMLPAWRRYKGVVWTHMEPATMSNSLRRSLLIPSGLYGVSSGTDLIADYRLKMGARIGHSGTLANFWRPHLTEVVRRHVGENVVVDLLPKEHQAALHIDVLASNCQLVSVSFVLADGRTAGGHGAKAVKGVFARALLDDGIEQIASFRYKGWRVRRTVDRFLVVAPKAP